MRASLVKKEVIAEGTMAFYFTKPAGFVYKAGQSVDLTLIGVPVTDSEGNSRSFSIASAPHEDSLMVATRMRNTVFKNTLKEVPPGTELVLDGPFGSFFLHENTKRPAVFLAGGIGITPFRSMSVDAVERNLSHTIILFYSNRRPVDAAFLDELTRLQQQNKNYTLVPLMSETEGYIDERKIKEHVLLDSLPVFYLAGPPKMVFAMRDLLQGLGISSDDIRFEEFAGY